MNEPLEKKINGFAFDPNNPLTVTVDELINTWEKFGHNYPVSDDYKKQFDNSMLAIDQLDSLNAGIARYVLYLSVISGNSNRENDAGKNPVQYLLDIASRMAGIAKMEDNNRFPFVKLEECVLSAGARHLYDKYAFMETIINEIQYLLTDETDRRSERAH